MKKGSTKTERIMRDFSFSYTSAAPLCVDRYENKAKAILHLFLQHTAVNFETQQWFIRFIKIIEKLQNGWKNYQRAKANRMKFLLFKWDYELENMIEYCQESKSK